MVVMTLHSHPHSKGYLIRHVQQYLLDALLEAVPDPIEEAGDTTEYLMGLEYYLDVSGQVCFKPKSQ